MRFRILYSDSLEGDNCVPLESEWRLARSDNPEAAFLSWTLMGTWSGLSVYRSGVSPGIPYSEIDNEQCDAYFESGNCRIYARVPPNCAGATLRVKSIAAEVYDSSP